MKKVVVLHTHVPGLGVIRALGMHGIPVIALHYEDREFGFLSKYVSRSIKLPHPELASDDFLQAIIDIGKLYPQSLLVPTNDLTLSIVSQNKSVFEEYYTVAVPEWDILKKVLIKKYTYAIAESAGVPIPKTITPKSIEDLGAIINTVEFPCIVKPTQVHIFFEIFGRKMFPVENVEQLNDAFVKAESAGTEVMIQELIPGDDTKGINYNSYFVDSQPIAEFTARKVRLDPPRFGSPRVITSEKIPEIISNGRKLLRALEFYGFSCTEFKMDDRDGLYKLMEVNGRHNLSGALAVSCGLNFPMIMYDHLCHNKLTVSTEFKSNIFWIDLTKDLFHSCLSRNQEKLSLRSLARPYLSENVFAVLSINDIVPFLKRTLYMFKRLSLSLVKRFFPFNTHIRKLKDVIGWFAKSF